MGIDKFAVCEVVLWLAEQEHNYSDYCHRSDFWTCAHDYPAACANETLAALADDGVI